MAIYKPEMATHSLGCYPSPRLLAQSVDLLFSELRQAADHDLLQGKMGIMGILRVYNLYILMEYVLTNGFIKV